MSGEVVRWPGHVRHNCRREHDGPGCVYCDGGLFTCRVCGGSEGALTTDCPGHHLDWTTLEEVYRGEKDYRHSTGWILQPSVHSPGYHRRTT